MFQPANVTKVVRGLLSSAYQTLSAPKGFVGASKSLSTNAMKLRTPTANHHLRSLARAGAHGHARGAIASQAGSAPATRASLACFCTSDVLGSVMSKKSPTTLGEILTEELKTEKSLYYRDEILDGVPAGFQLKETDGDSSLELVTEYKGETIAVVFSITEFRTEEEDYDFDDFEEDEDEEDEGGKKGEIESGDQDESGADDDDDYEEEPDPSIDFNVHVTKGKDTLTFECTTDGSIYSINTVNISSEDAPMDKLEYEGPNFEDLEENLQEGFFEYLHERGIDYEFSRYLFTVAMDKEQREYMNWLKDIQAFVAK